MKRNDSILTKFFSPLIFFGDSSSTWVNDENSIFKLWPACKGEIVALLKHHAMNTHS